MWGGEGGAAGGRLAHSGREAAEGVTRVPSRTPGVFPRGELLRLLEKLANCSLANDNTATTTWMGKKLDLILFFPFWNSFLFFFFFFFLFSKSWLDSVGEAVVFIGLESSECFTTCRVFFPYPVLHLWVLNINSSAKPSAVFNSGFFFF